MAGASPPEIISSTTQAQDIFSNNNERNLKILFELTPEEDLVASTRPFKLELEISRVPYVARLKVLVDGEVVNVDRGIGLVEKKVLVVANQKTINLEPAALLFKELANTMYIGPLRHIFGSIQSIPYFDMSIGQDFIGRWRSLKTGKIRSEAEKAHRLTEDIARIFGFDDLEINVAEDGTTLRLLVDKKSYGLVEQGNGLSQFILTMTNAAFRNADYLLIDEPENSLHPSLQLDFMTSIGRFANRGVLFATHSIGLARAAADRIYVVRKDGTKRVISDLSSTPSLPELLGEMSYSGYLELGYREVLLVEGTNEVKTFQQLLRLYRKDHQVVIIPLGGSALINARRGTELTELTRISQNIYAVIDSERTAENAGLSPERQGFAELCHRIKIQCCVLKRRAIENYFSERVVHKVLGDDISALGPYSALEHAWSKTDDWRLAAETTLEELEATDLGEFLKKFFGGSKGVAHQ